MSSKNAQTAFLGMEYGVYYIRLIEKLSICVVLTFDGMVHKVLIRTINQLFPVLVSVSYMLVQYHNREAVANNATPFVLY